MATERVYEPTSLQESQELAAVGQLMPTLVVGVGGTGTEVVRRIKKRLAERYEEAFIEYVCIDTDEGSFAPQVGLPDIEENEQIDIICRDAGSILNELNLHPELQQWFLPELPVELLEEARGAGAVRGVGRFALFARFQAVRNGLENAAARLMSTSERIKQRLGSSGTVALSEQQLVYVVGSVCGGTGAGVFLDIAFLTRWALKSARPSVHGILVTPSGFPVVRRQKPHLRTRMDANAYAALKELQHFMDPGARAAGWDLKYPGVSVPVERSPFDDCYLVGGTNRRGEQLPTKEAVFDMVAQAITAEIASPIGTAFRRDAANRHAAVLAKPDPVARVPQRQFSSFAVTSLIFPAQELMDFCCRRAALECISDHLLAGGLREAEAERAVATYLSRRKLNDFGPDNNDVVNALLTMEDGAAIASSAQYGVHQSALDEPNRDFLHIIDTRRTELDSVVLPRVEKRAGDHARALEQKSKQDLVAETERLLLSEGCRRTGDFLRKLHGAFTAMTGELEREQQDAQQMRLQTVRDIDQASDELRAYGGVIDLLFRPGLDEELKSELMHRLNELVDSEIISRGRAVAHRVFAALAEETERLYNDVCTGMRKLENLRVRLDGSVQNMRAATGAVTGSYCLAIRVTGEDYFDGFYAANRKDPKDLAASLDGSGALDLLRNSNEAQIGDSLLEEASRWFSGPLMAVNIVSELNAMAQKGDRTVAQRVSALLDTAFDVARPFWRIHVPGQTPMGTDYVVCTPGGGDEASRTAIKGAVDGWLEARAGDETQASHVETAYPHAIDVIRREHGARAYWLLESDAWYDTYRAVIESGGYPLHINRLFTTPPIPELAPEMELDSKQLFALAVAYGYIARRGPNQWYFGAVPNAEGALVPKYISDWDTIWSELGRGSEPIGATIQPVDMLANSRSGAVDAFIANSDARNRFKDIIAAYVMRVGSTQCTDELIRYVDEVLNVRIDQNTDLQSQYMDERDWIASYIWENLDDGANIPRVARS